MSGAAAGPGRDPGPHDDWPERPAAADPTPPAAGRPAVDPAPPTPVAAPRSPDRPRRRDRHGHGRRGPDHRSGLPDPTGALALAPRGVPADRSRRARFDQVAIDVLDDVETRLRDRLPAIDVAVEEVPVLPDGWAGEETPLGTLVPATRTSRARVVLYRRPIEHRVHGLAELTALVLLVVVEQVAEMLGVDPAELHPDYPQG